MASPIHQHNGPLPPGASANAGNGSPGSDSATSNPSHSVTRGISSSGNSRVHPPMHERSRNARAQARHRAKRKAYIEQLEETVARLQAALSPYPPPPDINGNAAANPNDQTQSSFNVSVASPPSVLSSSGNIQVGLGPSSASTQGQGSGIEGSLMQARLRALELECNALRTYAESLRGMLSQHAPGVQVPPMPLPSSRPGHDLAGAISSVPPALHTNLTPTPIANTNAGIGNSTRPPLNQSFPSFSSSSSGTGTYKSDLSGKVSSSKRARRDSNSPPPSASRLDAGERFGIGVNDGGNVGYSTPNPTPPLNHKPDILGNASHANSQNAGINANRPGVPPLTLPPVNQPNSGHPSSAHSYTSHANPTPPPAAYNFGSTSSQQPNPSPIQPPHQQHQSQTQPHAHSQATQQPPIHPMPPPMPWNGSSSVLSHGNINGLHLPPPIPRFGGTMPNLTRSFAYPLSTPSNASTSRQDGLEGGTHTERSRIGSYGGGSIGIGPTGNTGAPLKREEDGEPNLPTSAYGAVGTDGAYHQTQRHASGRHQQHESLHTISPTSATALSPATGYATLASQQQQQQHHSQIPSPHASQQAFSHQQTSMSQRPLPSPTSHQHNTQSHYHHSNNQHQALQASPEHLQTQHPNQHSGGALTSPHSPYSPAGPNVPGPYRAYPEERYHHQPGQQQAPAHHQNQSQSQSQGYMWSNAQTGVAYGGR